MEIIRIVKSPKEDTKLTRIYINPLTETLYENYTEGRFTRPKDEFRSSGLLNKILIEEMGCNPDALPTTKWSQTAGCSCECSPAFIVSGSRDYGYDIFCDYEPKSVAPVDALDEDFVAARIKTLYETVGIGH